MKGPRSLLTSKLYLKLYLYKFMIFQNVDEILSAFTNIGDKHLQLKQEAKEVWTRHRTLFKTHSCDALQSSLNTPE
jgi:hypothetical protein